MRAPPHLRSGHVREGGDAEVGAALAVRRLRLRRARVAQSYTGQVQQRLGRAPLLATAAVRVLVARAAGNHQVRGGGQLPTFFIMSDNSRTNTSAWYTNKKDGVQQAADDREKNEKNN